MSLFVLTIPKPKYVQSTGTEGKKKQLISTTEQWELGNILVKKKKITQTIKN